MSLLPSDRESRYERRDNDDNVTLADTKVKGAASRLRNADRAVTVIGRSFRGGSSALFRLEDLVHDSRRRW